jgi:hypothetical protein
MSTADGGGPDGPVGGGEPAGLPGELIEQEARITRTIARAEKPSLFT